MCKICDLKCTNTKLFKMYKTQFSLYMHRKALYVFLNVSQHTNYRSPLTIKCSTIKIKQTSCHHPSGRNEELRQLKWQFSRVKFCTFYYILVTFTAVLMYWYLSATAQTEENSKTEEPFHKMKCSKTTAKPTWYILLELCSLWQNAHVSKL